MATAKNWRKGFSAEQQFQRARPEYSNEFLNNPHKGTTTFQRFNGDPLYKEGWNDAEGPLVFPKPPRSLHNKNYPDTSMSYCRWLWSVLEPEKGKIRFDIIDGALRAAAERGQTLQLRTQPYIGDDAPEWFKQTGAKFYQQGDRPHPDHNDPLYIKHWGDHLRALGERYDGHPNLESFDIAYGGPCGEMGGNATCPTATRLVDIYVQAFQETQLVSMCGTAGAAYASKLKGRKIGWRGDCYGDMRWEAAGQLPPNQRWNHTFDEYPKTTVEDGNVDTWKIAPVTFETCWTVPYWHKQGWDIDYIIEQGYKYHISVFMPKSNGYPAEWMARLDEFNKRIGYRFHLMQMLLPLEAKPGAKIDAQVLIDNKGIAPIYRPYKMALRFVQGKAEHIVTFNQDIRTWLPDLHWFKESITFPRGLKKGTAEVYAGIVNAKNVPVVKFATKPVAKDGWLRLTFMDVV